MSKFGDILSSENIAYDEKFFQTAPNTTIVTNAALPFTVGSFNMPMTGILIADFKVRCHWTANMQGFIVTPAISTPTGTEQWEGVAVQNGTPSLTPYHVGLGKMYWESVTVGTPVTLKVQVTCSFFAPTITVDLIQAVARSHRT